MGVSGNPDKINILNSSRGKSILFLKYNIIMKEPLRINAIDNSWADSGLETRVDIAIKEDRRIITKGSPLEMFFEDNQNY